MALPRDTNVYAVNTTRVLVASHNERALVVGGGVADPLTIEVPCPALTVDTRASSAASTGLKITAAAAGGGVTLSALSSAPTEALRFEPKGAGGIVLGRSDASSGPVTINGNLVVSGTVSASGNVLGSGGGSVPFPLVVEGAGNAAAFSVRPAVGSANPSFVVDTSASSATAGTGIVVTAATATNGVSIAARSSNAAESLSLSSLGTGSLKLQTAASGGPIVCATNIIYKRSITSYPGGASYNVTVAELFGGYLKVSTTGSTTLRVPSSNLIVATLALVIGVGDSFEFIVDNMVNSSTVTLDNTTSPIGNIEFSGSPSVAATQIAIFRMVNYGAKVRCVRCGG